MSKPHHFQPDDALLKRFADGRLDSDAEMKVAVAIENSPDLQARIAAISSDGFLDRVKEIAKTSRMSKPKASDRSKAKPKTNSLPQNAVDGVPRELAESREYQVLKELGRGGMGVVYAAKYLPMDRMEVLKVLNDQMVKNEAAKLRFVSEMRAIGKLNHANIAKAYQRVVLPTQLVFSMEYVPGIDLQKFIQKYHPVPIPVVCTLTSQIATALQHAHSKGMVHRDIKPSNVMVFKEDGRLQIKILDFGLAKATSEQQAPGLTADGSILGTPEYMAPEQALDAANADIRADIYSLGCTLYHLLRGKPPFSGTLQSVLMDHAKREADPIHLFRTDIPAELSMIVAKMMAKQHSKRFKTPRHICEALKPFCGSFKLKSLADDLPGEKDTKLSLVSSERDTSVEIPEQPLAWIPSEKNEASPSKFQIQTPTPVPGTVGSKITDDRTSPSINVFPGERSTRRKSPPRFAIFVAVLFAAAAVWGTVLSVQTRKGKLVITNLPVNAEVEVDGDQIDIKMDGAQWSATTTLSAGKYEVIVKVSGVQVQGETVSINAGGEQRIVFTNQGLLKNPGTDSDEMTASPPDADLSALSDSKPRVGEWSFDEGIVQQHQLGKHGTYLVFGSDDWENYRFSFDARRISGSHGFKALFNWKDKRNHMIFGLGNYQNRWHDVSFESQGSWGRNPKGHFVRLGENTKIEVDRWYQVEVRVTGASYECYLDGKLICKGKNDRFQSGRVGLSTWDANAQFKNIAVRSPDGKTLWPG